MKFVCGNVNRVVFQFSKFKSIDSEVILDRAECPLPMSTKDLSRIVSAIPLCANSLHLILRDNDDFDLKEVFPKIPSHITQLTVTWNQLSNQSTGEQKEIARTIPETVTQIHLPTANDAQDVETSSDVETASNTSKPPPSLMSNMNVLGHFVGTIGIDAIAIAMVVLHLAAVGVLGVVATGLLVTFSLFNLGRCILNNAENTPGLIVSAS